VVFVDLVGFTAQAEALDPEDVGAVLAPYHARVKADLERHGGTVEKFIGDAVMAIFGAPVAREDDPERAVRAALAVRDGIVDEGQELRVRIGVNTGDALVTLGARPERGETIAVGDVLNTAARLQVAARENEILVGAITYRATASAIDYGQPVSLTAKGKAQPLLAWPAREAHSRSDSDPRQKAFTPLVGRRREIGVLTATLARVRAERSPQLVSVVGAPGIGKSRLIAELFGGIEQEPELTTWRVGRSPSYGANASFSALGEIVKAQAGILESDSTEAAERKVADSLAELIADPAERNWIKPHLRPLIGLAGKEPRESVGETTFAAWTRFVEAVAEQRPAVLVFEDLQWAGDALLDFVDYLAEWASQVPLFLLGSARPELLDRRPAWRAAKPNVTTISLSPLSDSETGLLVDAVLGSTQGLPGRSAVIDLAAGNPLFAEQFAYMLRERGDESGLPDSVHGVIAARIDALPWEAKTVLQDAAVIGRVFWPGAVAAIGDADAAGLRDSLQALERQGLVRRVRRASVASEAEFSFHHVLIRDVAYGQIPRARRADKHRRAAEWTAALAPDRTEDRVEMLAHHYQSALTLAGASGQSIDQFVDAARDSFAAAGARAWAFGSYAASARHFDSALTVSEADHPSHAEWLFASARAHYWSDGTGFDQMRSAVATLRDEGKTAEAAEAAAWISRASSLRGDFVDADAYADLAVELTASFPNSAARVAALAARATLYMIEANEAEAIRIADEALPLAKQLGLEQLQARILTTLGKARFNAGDRGGIAQMEEAIAVAQRINSLERLHSAYDNLAAAQHRLGLRAECFATLELLRQSVERHGSRDDLRWLRFLDAEHAFEAGDWKEALPAIQDLIDEFLAGISFGLAPPCFALRALCSLARGDIAAAERDAREATRLAEATKLRPAADFPLTVLAMVLHENDRRDEVESIMSRLIASPIVRSPFPYVSVELASLAADLGWADRLRPALENSRLRTPWDDAALAILDGEPSRAADIVSDLVVLCSEAYVRLYAGRCMITEGRMDEAVVQLTRAKELCRGMEASGWAQRADEMLAIALKPAPVGVDTPRSREP
jgi:class 3 adenylate cyclase/tetratricopeptide (TPR) repeat protein